MYKIFHILFCPSFRLQFVPFPCFVFLLCFSLISSLSVFYFFFFMFCYVLLSVSNLFPFLVLFSCLSVFLSFASPSVHLFRTPPMSLTTDSWTDQLLPITLVVEYPQQVDLRHLRMDPSIWSFQAESGRHARLVATADNTGGQFSTQTISSCFQPVLYMAVQ